MKIRTKLILVFQSMIFITMLILISMLYFTITSNFENNAGERLQDNVVQVAKAIDAFMFTRVKDLKAFSNNPIFSVGTTEDVAKYLSESVRLYPFYDTLSYTDIEGVILASSNESLTGKNIIEIEPDIKEEFQKAISGGPHDVYISDIAEMSQMELLSNAPLDIELLSAVLDKNGAKMGTLIGFVNIQFLENLVLDIDDRTVGNEYAYLVNDPGDVVITADSKAVILEPHPDLKIGNLKQKLEGDEDGYMVYLNSKGRKVVSAYADLSEYGTDGVGDWSLISTAPYKDIMAPLYSLMYGLLFVFLLILTLAFVAVIFLSRTLTKPIMKLQNAADEIARGNFNVQIEIKSRDEIGALAGTFNLMIKDLGKSRDEIVDAKNYVENILRGMIDSLIVATPDGTIQTVNQSACDLLGYRKEELIGQPIGMIYVEKVGTHFNETGIIGSIKKGLISDVEGFCLTKDGSKISVLFSGSVMYDNNGKIQGVICLMSNITEIMRVQEALRESEEKYRTILESMEEGYYEVDLAGNFIFFNDAMCKIRGYSREELMGMSNREYMTEETAKEVFKAFSNVYTTGKPAKNLEWETIRKDGTKGYVETSASLAKNSVGEPIGFRGVVRDISEKQRLEAQLQHAKRMESVGTLAGGIAHNFNNLLMGIQGNASMMLLDIDSSNPRHKNLTNIEKLVENGAKLTAQLIGYAREGSYEVKPTSLNQLVKETSDTFGMTKKEITVHQGLSEKLYGIKADQGQIEQVLLNLYVNAADAMPEGGDLFLKTINVTDKDITGKPYKVQLGNYVLLTVRDTGAGMDKETRERIFEPFFTTKGLASGTGLGMASAYGTVKGHGGYIDVDSEVGKGTTFSIYLPATEKVIEEKEVLSDELVKGEGTVLLVDDEEMVLEAGEELLNHLGYEVLLAENGREALELYKKNQDKIDMVLLDMVMPVMGGGEAFDRMKEINTNVKVLLSSGYSLEGEANEILKRGCDAFIQKPFKLEQLSQKLMKILDKK
jgi:two-component system, cell cycle sensor histidine kinase and response regulator CckA